MTSKSIGLPDDVYDYVLAHGVREPVILARLREETAAHPMAQMQIEPLQGAIFRLLVELLDALGAATSSFQSATRPSPVAFGSRVWHIIPSRTSDNCVRICDCCPAGKTSIIRLMVEAAEFV